ncbi:Uu.00g057580.m01.CDS01 [Anthostomella pinea]|uniref:Uu.00g057580.m01.CDS01 n=1 Tax=Anthostomella pinea TaxID=933095 RepID=A0AAI8YM23_9PEZI|nr:Uu.00g057580.m01.CDS01 [Anthostomella pinea]
MRTIQGAPKPTSLSYTVRTAHTSARNLRNSLNDHLVDQDQAQDQNQAHTTMGLTTSTIQADQERSTTISSPTANSISRNFPTNNQHHTASYGLYPLPRSASHVEILGVALGTCFLTLLLCWLLWTALRTAIAPGHAAARDTRQRHSDYRPPHNDASDDTSTTSTGTTSTGTTSNGTLKYRSRSHDQEAQAPAGAPEPQQQQLMRTFANLARIRNESPSAGDLMGTVRRTSTDVAASVAREVGEIGRALLGTAADADAEAQHGHGHGHGPDDIPLVVRRDNGTRESVDVEEGLGRRLPPRPAAVSVSASASAFVVHDRGHRSPERKRDRGKGQEKGRRKPGGRAHDAEEKDESSAFLRGASTDADATSVGR